MQTVMANAFAPLRSSSFRTLWVVQLSGQLITWTHSVVAQWMLTAAGEPAAVVALVTTAAALPFFLFGMFAGSLADTIGGRPILMVVQPVLLALAITISVLAFLGILTTPLLIGATFLLGTAATFQNPVVMSALHTFVGRPLIPAAISLVSINANGARIGGPVIAGFLIATAFGAPSVFILNVLVAVVSYAFSMTWPRGTTLSGGGQITGALRTAFSFVRLAPRFRGALLSGGLFVVPATAIWALVAVIAHDELGMDAGGFGALFACIGVGAIVAALIAPRIHRQFKPAVVLCSSSLVYGAATMLFALTHEPLVAGIALAATGAGWMLGASTVQIACQLILPEWIRGRGIAAWYTVLFGSQACGSLLWGALANLIGSGSAVIVAAVIIVLTGLFSWVRNAPSVRVSHQAVEPSTSQTLPDLPRPAGPGPFVIIITYAVEPAGSEEFERRAATLGRSRRRTGSRHWRMMYDALSEGSYFETYEVDSWDEHLRQLDRRRYYEEAAIEAAFHAVSTVVSVNIWAVTRS